MDSKVEIEHIMPVIGIKHNVLKQCAGIHHTDDFKRISETIGNKILSPEGIHKSIGKEYFSLKKSRERSNKTGHIGSSYLMAGTQVEQYSILKPYS